MIRRNGHPSVTQGAPPLAKPTPASPIVAVPVRVALLSDSALFRSGLHRLLGSDPSFLVVAELTASPIRDRLRSSLPHILLVDAQTEGALEICRELRLKGVRPWVILAGADRDERWAVEALKTGARGILSKSATVESLLKAVRVVHQGEVWASKRVIALTVEELAARSVNSPAGRLALSGCDAGHGAPRVHSGECGADATSAWRSGIRDHRRQRCSCRGHIARRLGVVDPLRHRGVFRDDRLGYRRLFLMIRNP